MALGLFGKPIIDLDGSDSTMLDNALEAKEVRDAALDSLSKLREYIEAGTQVMTLKRDQDRIKRARAARLLGVIAGPLAVDALLDGLKDEEISVRLTVIETLEKLGDPKAVGPLETLLRRHGSEDFTVTTQDQMLDVLGSVLDVLKLAVGALGDGGELILREAMCGSLPLRLDNRHLAHEQELRDREATVLVGLLRGGERVLVVGADYRDPGRLALRDHRAGDVQQLVEACLHRVARGHRQRRRRSHRRWYGFGR